MMDAQQVKNILEACLLVAGKAMSVRQLGELFDDDETRPDKDTIKSCIAELQADYEGRGIELVQVASGYRLQSRTEMSHWVARLFPEKPPRYSRALLETLVLVAYRQPITRGEIEEIRGVAVSSNIVKTLQERQWVKEVGFKDVPGKPALLATTKEFLDYFNLKRLDDLPPLSEIKNLDEMDAALMEAAGIAPPEATGAANDDEASVAEPAASSEEGELAGNATSADVATADSNLESDTDTASESEETQDAEPSNPNDVPAQLVEGSDARDAPVTFAGLLSGLPPLGRGEPASDDVQNDAESELSSTDHLAESVKTDSESSESETALEQSEAEKNMRIALDEFAAEHKQEVEARDQLESQFISDYKEPASAENAPSASSEPEVDVAKRELELETEEAGNRALTEDELAADALGDLIDASSASPEVLSETFTDDSASAGETLH